MDDVNAGHDRLWTRVTLIIQAWLALGLAVFVIRRDWENAALTLVVMALNVGPAFLLRRHKVHIPPEFQLIAAIFITFSFFLGSAHDFYYRFWWWDMILHTTFGGLLGVVGWIVLFLLNQTDRIPRGMKPGFVCFFAVTFTALLGILWEIFEFVVDSFWPEVNMMSHETGVTDTIQDLIVDLVGGVIVALMGYAYSRSGRYSFLIDAIRKFLRKNAALFPGQERSSGDAPE